MSAGANRLGFNLNDLDAVKYKRGHFDIRLIYKTHAGVTFNALKITQMLMIGIIPVAEAESCQVSRLFLVAAIDLSVKIHLFF